jgi:hypothetical protein
VTALSPIKRSVANRSADVFVRADLRPFGSVLWGKPIPIKSLEVLAPEALKKLGVEVAESRQTREYNAGRSTQIPAGIVRVVVD